MYGLSICPCRRVRHLPLAFVFQTLFLHFDKLVDTVGLDLLSPSRPRRRSTQVRPKTVYPSPPCGERITLHRAITRNQILDGARQHMSACGSLLRRRPLVKRKSMYFLISMDFSKIRLSFQNCRITTRHKWRLSTFSYMNSILHGTTDCSDDA